MKALQPLLLAADVRGNICEDPDRLMLCRRGRDLALPRPDELMPLPEESELFLLPGRRALGYNPENGEVEEVEDSAVAAFAAPAHTLTAHPAYRGAPGAPMLPLFAYGAVGYAHGRIYVCAKKVDDDPRQMFGGISGKKLRRGALELAEAFPENRLVQQLTRRCALTYSCPAARNFCLGRYEAPLPVSRRCNARCVGCISRQEQGSKICAAPQSRLDFTPSPEEVVEVMRLHQSRAEAPIYSFGQGCEGEPLTESDLLEESIRCFRAQGGEGTVNLNSNASMPGEIARLCAAGLSSLRVSLNSAREESYLRYYRPVNFSFAQVLGSIDEAKSRGVFVSLNLLFFPGFTDTELEFQALEELARETRLDCVQLRNLNIDPEYYLDLMQGVETGPGLGFGNFKKRLLKACPWLKLGYFNPVLPLLCLCLLV
ncbi:MAG: radical SAM protein [Desulfovibrionaceae bacterium]|nr:radical SAM protein [Desulfovibrionaceae bacterium]